MGLPKIDQPLFETTLPSTGEKLHFHPFRVKEEKLLLIAKESKDVDQAILAIKQIINNCFQDIDVDNIAMFDLEYLLIQLRSKSVSNEVEFGINDPDTEEEIKLKLNLNDIEIVKDEKHDPLIPIQGDLYIKMNYPNLDDVKKLSGQEGNDPQRVIFETMMGCIGSVIQGDEVYKLSDFSEKEVSEFLDSLSSKNINSIKTFFETMPKMRYEKKYKRKDGTEKTFVAEGTETFFI